MNFSVVLKYVDWALTVELVSTFFSVFFSVLPPAISMEGSDCK